MPTPSSTLAGGARASPPPPLLALALAIATPSPSLLPFGIGTPSSSSPLPFFVDAAAGYPLVRDSSVFNPLSCNADLDSVDCATSTSLESIVVGSSDAAADESVVVVPCGTCATLTTTDGSIIDLGYRALNVEGKLHVPSYAHATLRTTGVFVQGELVIDPPDGRDGLTVSLRGTDDVFVVPHAENADRCPGEGGACNLSSKAVVVAGGRLDIRGDRMTTSPACKTWTTIKDVGTTDPVLPSHPSCDALDGGIMDPSADGTFESSSTSGFQRYRAGRIEIGTEEVAADPTAVNTYLHNRNRGNVKDGLRIDMGNHTECVMLNRVYRMSLRYRLNLDGDNADGGSHRPKIEIDHADRDLRRDATAEHHRIVLGDHYELPPTTDGEWASATFLFNSFDVRDMDVAFVKVTWPTSATATADYDDISILPVLTDPPGTPDVFYVEPEVAACWSDRVGAELLVTSDEVGKLKTGWDEEDVAIVTAVDVDTGAIYVADPLPRYKTSEAQDPRFATEVAILHRSTAFVAEEDDPDQPWLGGHSIIKHTLAPQVISGAAFYNFGQQGRLGKYPIHFHMAGDHPNSIVSKNLVRNSHQRCIVVHGTDSVLVEENVAYNTTGHCYINENGVEEGIRFHRNLGALTLRQPEERRIGSPPESDHRAYTFWFTNANVHVVGNVAAGANLGGYWYETFEHAPHGPYADWPEYADFNPKVRPLGSFIDNVVHSSGERGIRMYEPGYKPNQEFTFYNTRAYKNNDHGMFIHGVQYMVVDGGVFADNKVAIRNFNGRTIFKNLELIGTSELVHTRDPYGCHAKVGLQQKINAGWNDGSVLANVTFSGLKKHGCDDSRGFEFYHLLNEKRFVGNTHFSDIHMEPGADRGDLVELACRFAEDPFNIENIIVEDHDGTLGLTGNPGFYTSDSPLATAFIPDATCVTHPRGCGKWCDNVCLRNVEVKINTCGDPCLNHTMKVSNGIDSFDYGLHLDQSDAAKHRYEPVLPKGTYEITFYDQDGNLDEGLEPGDITIILGDEPQCADHLVEADLALRTKAPTPSPTTTPLLEPLYSETIIAPADPIVKIGTNKWTSDPQTVISGNITTYSLYTDDIDLPAFSVKPASQHTCSIVKGIRIWTSPSSSGKDPDSYKIEGRYGIHDEWSLMSQGPLSLPAGRNIESQPIAEAEFYETVLFQNHVAVFREYRVSFSGGGGTWLRVGQVQFAGYFVSCDHIMPLPTASPTRGPSKSPTLSPTTTASSNPLLEPLYSETIIAPTDPILKIGTHKWTSDPQTVINGSIATYSLYLADQELPAFSVKPATQHSCSIVQGLKVYTDSGNSGKDPNSYKLEGRYGFDDEWSLISEGPLNLPAERNIDAQPIAEAEFYETVLFQNNINVYREYRVSFSGGTTYWLRVGQVQFTGYFVACNHVMALPTTSPTSSPTVRGTDGPTATPQCPEDCFDRCVDIYGGTIESGSAFRCAKGCAGMASGGVVEDPDKYCQMDSASRYSTCYENCQSENRQWKRDACAVGCEFWLGPYWN